MKIYRLYGIENAIEFLRPGAKWEYVADGGAPASLIWLDERPCPTVDEINETLKKILDFENSITTIWTEKQTEQFLDIGIVDFLPPLDKFQYYKDFFEIKERLKTNGNTNISN